LLTEVSPKLSSATRSTRNGRARPLSSLAVLKR
jgi:hypothetical protein